MAEWVWKGGLDSAIGMLRLVFDTAALRRQQLGYTVSQPSGQQRGHISTFNIWPPRATELLNVET